MGELTKASMALQTEVINAKRKLVLLQGANKHLQRLCTDYNRQLSDIISQVNLDPNFPTEKSKEKEIDRLTDPLWNKLDKQKGKTVLLAKDWVAVNKTLPPTLQKVVAVLMRYDTKGKDSKAKKAADARAAVDKGLTLLKIVSSDLKEYQYLYSSQP